MKGEIMRRVTGIVLFIALLMPTGMTESDECNWGGYMSLTEMKREPGFVTMYWRIFLEEDASSAARVIRDVATSADRIAVLFGMSTMEQYTGDQIDGSYLLNVYDSDGNYLYGYAVKTNLALDNHGRVELYKNDVLLNIYDAVYRFSDCNSVRFYKMPANYQALQHNKVLGKNDNKNQDTEEIQILQGQKHYLSVAKPNGERVVVIDYRREFEELYALTDQTRIVFAIVGFLVLAGAICVCWWKHQEQSHQARRQ